ncbi:MAG TPA: divergent polysaccharide deacetylase family protein [Acetobacteraceae bacterium]|nr:divergent polysaccharide deacetylase family protein [Acetobacteraceae bacterium]
MTRADDSGAARLPLAWRLLIGFWMLIVLAGAGGAAVLAYLGPLPAPPPRPAAPVAQAAPSPAPPPQPPAPATAVVQTPSAPQRPAGTPIAAPDPALLDASAAYPTAKLPRIGADGRTPMQTYAAGYDPADMRPKIGILLAGIGQSSSGSDDALRSLPPEVSFAVSPYTPSPDNLLGDIRAKGHEFLISIPMEPQGYPTNDEGAQSLLIGATAQQNARRLDWALSRIQGYAGATNALDGMRGERFTASTTQFRPLLEQLASRGVLFVDASPETDQVPFSSVPRLTARRIDITVDAPAVRSEIDWKLAQLEGLARDRGAAIGLALLPRPVTVAVLAQWSATLKARGLALAPISAIVRMPEAAQPRVVNTNVSR